MGCGSFSRRSGRGRLLMFLGKPETRNQKPETRSACTARSGRRFSGFWFLVSGLLLVVSCRQKMAVQPRYDPLEPSDFFSDHMSSRPRIPGTVARGELAITGFL